jgi:hypothetical protein
MAAKGSVETHVRRSGAGGQNGGQNDTVHVKNLHFGPDDANGHTGKPRVEGNLCLPGKNDRFSVDDKIGRTNRQR